MMTTSPSDASVTGFSSLGLSDTLIAAVAALGYEEPTPIQREAIPVLLSGRDLLGQAGTGTGKTAAFALPMIDRLAKDPGSRSSSGGVARGMVLVPTRELAMQVSEAIYKYAKGSNLTVVPLYGGAPMDQQIRGLRRGADIVVATPGRALDHLRRKTLNLDELAVLVLDEADEMLDMGFAEDLEAILGATPEDRQTALFAATMPPRIGAIAVRHLNKPSRITIGREKRPAGKLPQVRQAAYIVSREQKTMALGRILEFESPKSAIVFCRTRIEVDELTDVLTAHGYGAQALHGGMEQKQRDRVMQLFRKEQAEILVATDVAARGLDIEHVSHVINYDVPNAPEVYVHRIGRTGRVGREGVAITIADSREQRFLRSIEGLTKQKIDIKALPTVADLRVRRLEVTRESLHKQLTAKGFEEMRGIVESLAQEFDVIDVAAAAIKLAHDASDQATPLQPVKPAPGRVEASSPERRFKPGGGARPYGRSDVPDRSRPAGPRGSERDRPTGPRPTPPRRHAGLGEPLTTIHISAGKKNGVRPGDLVGAIAGEANIDSKVLGAIRIADDYSLVEVPEALASRIMVALRATKVRGNQVDVRLEKDKK